MIGYGILALGIVIILFTFVLGYGIYINTTNQANNFVPQQNFSYSGGSLNASIAGVISTFTNNTFSLVKSSSYVVLEVLVLFLFLNIGYKIAKIGLEKLDSQERKEKK